MIAASMQERKVVQVGRLKSNSVGTRVLHDFLLDDSSIYDSRQCMKTQDITDITVSVRAANAASIQWKANGLRYHMNVLRDTLQVTEGFMSKGKRVILVNSMAEYGKPGWFQTRKLDADAASNAKVVAHLIDYVKTNDLIEAAFEAQRVAKDEEETQRRANLIAGVSRVLGSEGYDVTGIDYETAVRIMDGIRKI